MSYLFGIITLNYALSKNVFKQYRYKNIKGSCNKLMRMFYRIVILCVTTYFFRCIKIVIPIY